MMPSQAFHDAGEFQTVITTMQIAHPTGFPTYILFGKIFSTLLPFGESAFKANLLSVFYSIGALGFLWLFLKKLTKSYYMPLIACLVYAFVWPFWNNAGIADSHTLNRLFLFLILYLTLSISQKWSLIAWTLLCLSVGLGLGNHLLLVYFMPGIVFWLLYLIYKGRVEITFSLVLLSLTTFLLGLSIYVLLPLVGYDGIPHNANYSLRTWEGFSRHVFGGDFRDLMFSDGLMASIRNMLNGLVQLSEFVYSHGIILGCVGLLYGLRTYSLSTIATMISFLSLLTFSTNYPTSDSNRYFMSYVGIFCIWIGLGIIFITKCVNSFYHNHPQSRVFFNTVTILIILVLPLSLLWNNYEKVDKSQNYDARDYSRKIFQKIPQNTVLITWWHYYTPIWYRQAVLQERPDVLIRNSSSWREIVEQYIDSRPVYMVDNNLEIEENYNVTREGDVLKVTRKED